MNNTCKSLIVFLKLTFKYTLPYSLHTHTNIYVRIHTYIIYINIHIYICIYVNTHTYVYECMYVYMYILLGTRTLCFKGFHLQCSSTEMQKIPDLFKVNNRIALVFSYIILMIASFDYYFHTYSILIMK